MRLYGALGCRATWTCAPYQLQQRPSFGQHVAWAESNAIVFANSVLGARTERYGDFIDIAAALIGRAPYAGLHRDEGRFARVVFRLRGITPALAESDVLFAALGHLIGRRAGGEVAAIDGLSHATEDQLKALGAAAASSGACAMFHVVGVTPEAPTLEAACGGAVAGRAGAGGAGAGGAGAGGVGAGGAGAGRADDVFPSGESVSKRAGKITPHVVELTIDDLSAAARELSSAAGDRESPVNVTTETAGIVPITPPVSAGPLHSSTASSAVAVPGWLAVAAGCSSVMAPRWTHSAATQPNCPSTLTGMYDACSRPVTVICVLGGNVVTTS
jgi:hypothetical protein